MGQVIRVMLADDSSIVRRLLTQVISGNPRCQLVFSAKNGQEAVDNFKAMAPDIVILDVEMPVMDGIEAVSRLKSMDADLPIIMCSSLTSRGGQATIEALASGASDYITKPSGVGHVNEALAQLERELLPKIILWGDRRLARRSAKSSTVAKTTTYPVANPRPAQGFGTVGIVAVGVSTGGPNALAEFLPGLAHSLCVPMVIAQHMPPTFTKLLADRLSATSRLPVREAEDGSLLEPGTVWIAPGDYHLVVKRQGTSMVCALNRNPPENSCRPSVDVLFRSVAECYGKQSLAVVLTGMGRDGVVGCQRIRECGGRIVVQDEASSTVWGMPRAVAEAGLADQILPVREIGVEIGRHLKKVPVPLAAR